MTPLEAARIVFNVRPTALRIFVEGKGMPTYEYRCENCGKRFSRIESISEHGRKRPACPKCKSRRVAQVLAPFFAKTKKKS